jgi:UDP-N-acetylmuramoyl-tripeptide--D-alanyl-D-alanine ligase
MDMIRWLSRRHPRYIRSLVYMLQASEYNTRDFLRWFARERDFRTTEKRKTLLFTPKARILFMLGWLAVPLGLFLAVLAWVLVPSMLGKIHAVLILLEIPILILAVLIFANVLLALMQKPVERSRVRRAQKILASHKAVKIAIAGSYGKTTMREILKTTLGEARNVAAVPGSYNTPLGIASFVQSLKCDEEVLIFELGEYFPGDIAYLCEMIRPDIGVITGVNEAHLEKFRTVDAAAHTIFELAEYVPQQSLYINVESKHLPSERVRAGDPTFDRGHAGQWRIENIATSLGGTSFEMLVEGERIAMRSGLLGAHMVGPLGAAFVIAKRIGLTDSEAQRGISNTIPFEHRMQPSTDASGVTTIDDSYNGNPDGIRAGIQFLRDLAGHRRIYVTPGLVEGGNLTQSLHAEIGRNLATSGIEIVILIRNSVTPYIERALREQGYPGNVYTYDDMLLALKAIRAMTVPGDVVLIQNDWPDQYA